MTTIVGGLTQTRSWIAENNKLVLAALLVLALIYPFTVRTYYVSVAIELLVFAIFAMSLDLILGYTGLPSFGHAAFFGLGGYIVAYISSRSDLALNLTGNLLVTLPAVMIITGLVALLIGLFALRTSGLYFLMITLAFAQMLFSIAVGWTEVTGGSDGIFGVAAPSIGIGPLSYEIASREGRYYLTLILFIASWWILYRIINSPFGWTLRGIRENEARMKALGYNTFYYKIVAFVIGGAFAGLAGMLLVTFFQHAPPEYLYWSMSGQVMIMLIVGGAGTLTGPILGAALVRYMHNVVSSATDRWELVIGLVFIGFVLFAPKGIMGLLTNFGRSSDDESAKGR